MSQPTGGTPRKLMRLTVEVLNLAYVAYRLGQVVRRWRARRHDIRVSRILANGSTMKDAFERGLNE